jgi:hypothetical protein
LICKVPSVGVYFCPIDTYPNRPVRSTFSAEKKVLTRRLLSGDYDTDSDQSRQHSRSRLITSASRMRFEPFLKRHSSCILIGGFHCTFSRICGVSGEVSPLFVIIIICPFFTLCTDIKIRGYHIDSKLSMFASGNPKLSDMGFHPLGKKAVRSVLTDSGSSFLC